MSKPRLLPTEAPPSGLLILSLLAALGTSVLAQDELPTPSVILDQDNQSSLSWPGESGLLYGVSHSQNLTDWTTEPISRIGNGFPINVPLTDLLPTPLPAAAFFQLHVAYRQNEDGSQEDILTPVYYNAAPGDAFRSEVNRFIRYVRREVFHHPLQSPQGQIPGFSVPGWGGFGAGKPVGGTAQHHAATDIHISGAQTAVNLYAAHSGIAATFRDADKYRHYLSITKDVVTGGGEVVGRLVTIYGHIDLDLDEAASLFMNGVQVEKGDLVSSNLYAGTVGGPHLHFEIRYYRPTEAATENYYGIAWPGAGGDLTEPGAGSWPYGVWNPNVGYGFADPDNHGLALETE